MIKLTCAMLRTVASAGIILACATVIAQEPGAVPPIWQPFRELPTGNSVAEAVALPQAVANGELTDLGSPVRQTQWVEGDAMPCPQPVCGVPACDISCYLDSANGPPTDPAYWQWRVLPDGVIWQSYWAGAKEPRISGTPFFDDDDTALLDVTLGGRASLLRFGTEGPGRPQGAELQIEGAAFPRLNLDENWDMESNDFRFGVPLVYGREMWQAKFSYYHLSSHMGDEFAIRNGGQTALDDRINFSRDALVMAFSYFPLPAWRWYAEAGWAFHADVSDPWEFQFGVDVAEPGPTGIYGTPFIAVNGHLRQEVDFGGNVVAQAGWLWRGDSTRTVRVGVHYFNGKSNQFQFFNQFEEQIGLGLWCDF